MTHDPKLVETVARAAYARTCEFWAQAFPDKAPHEPWERETDMLREHWLEFARAALSAINASGTHWVAPVEATDAMVEEGAAQVENGLFRIEPGVRSAWQEMRTAYLAEQPDKPIP